MSKSRSGSAWIVAVLLWGLLAGTGRTEQRIYWCDEAAAPTTIQRVNLSGGTPETFVTSPCTGHVLVDPLSTREVFFVEAPHGDSIDRVSLDGGPVTRFITFADNPIAGFSLEPGVNGPMYFVGNSGGVGGIFRSNLDGTDITFVRTTASFAFDLQLDPIRDKIYWVEADGIHKADQTGTSPQLIISTPGIQSIAVDSVNGLIYWTNDTGDNITRANLDGSGLTTILSGGSVGTAPKGIRLDGLGKMYWIDGSAHALRSANVDGTNLTTIAQTESLSDFFGLEVGFFKCGATIPFGDVNGVSGPNFADINIVVSCFQGNASCGNVEFNRSDLSPCNSATNTCQGDGKVNFQDINQAVNAFKGLGCV